MMATKAIPGDDGWADHRLVLSRMRIRLQPSRRPQGKRPSGNLLAEKNRPHQAYANRPTDNNKAAFYRSRHLLQQRLQEIQEAQTIRRAEKVLGYADRKEWENYFAAIEAVYGRMAKGTVPLLSADGITLTTEKTQILQRWA
ncbi:hypothetical protein SprV_0501891800 [Sparganum proliferum]